MAWAEGFATPTVAVPGQPPLILSVATSNILDVLGVQPVLGRGFVPNDAVSEIRPVILTRAAWQRDFGGSPAVLAARWGTGPLSAYQVIGVLPSGFLLPSSRFMERCDGLFARTGAWVGLVPGASSVGAVARLRPGISIDAAEAEIAGLMKSVDDWGSANLRSGLREGISPRVVVQP